MLRNIDSRFSRAPMTLDVPRSRFDRSQDHKTTFNAGDLVPIFCDEVLPGDTFDLSTSYVCRMSTPIFPVMDNAYLETFFFFVPTRLIWEHWKEFNGENNSSYWAQQIEYNVPQLFIPVSHPTPEGDDVVGFTKGSVADYFGLPTNVAGSGTSSVSALPFRAYVKCWNDWFRDQNVMQPAFLPVDDSTRTGVPSVTWTGPEGSRLPDPRTDAVLGGSLLKVSKYHDYFTSALPAPQKGPGVTVSGQLNGLNGGNIPVFTDSVNHTRSQYPIKLFNSNADFITGTAYPLGSVALSHNTASMVSSVSGSQALTDENVPLVPINLYASGAEFANANVSLLVNDIRLAFQIQKIYETDARGGTRYIELIKSHFGVDSPDARLQRSEYLGGTRQLINMNQVVQTSSTNEVSPIGTTSAYSLTHGNDQTFIKSFTEHGYIIGVCCVRTDHTYQQGINRMWSRKRRFDFYWPALANIGEQAILKKEILFTGDDDINEEAFGYQEAWADYRYKPSIVTGAFRSNVNGSLDSWHYADYFAPTAAPTMVIDEPFVLETSVNVDRTLAVQSSLEDQFIADFGFNCKTTRVMPLYSVPGLVDHH